MFILHDIVGCFYHRKREGYEIPDFHEWRDNEQRELLLAVPLVKVSQSFFIQLRDTMRTIPNELIDKVWRKAMFTFNGTSVVGQCVFVATDGYDVVVIDTVGHRFPMRKSKLPPLQHRMALQIAETLKAEKVESTLTESDIAEIHKNYHEFAGLGLTRLEREDFATLMSALKQVEHEGNLSKLQYLYKEYDYEGYANCLGDDFPTLLTRIKDKVLKEKLGSNTLILCRLLGVEIKSRGLILN